MGLGFIHLGFLAAAAAVAVPIVIHLLFRQRGEARRPGHAAIPARGAF